MAREFTPAEEAAAIEYMQNMRADEDTLAETKTFIDSNTGEKVAAPRFDYLSLGDRIINDSAIVRTLPSIQENFESLPLDFQNYVLESGLSNEAPAPVRSKTIIPKQEDVVTVDPVLAPPVEPKISKVDIDSLTPEVATTSLLNPTLDAFFSQPATSLLNPTLDAFFSAEPKEEEEEKLTADQLPIGTLLGGGVDTAAQGATPEIEPGTGVGDSYIAKGLGLTTEQFKALPTVVSLQANAAQLEQLQAIIPLFDRLDAGEPVNKVMSDAMQKRQAGSSLRRQDYVSRYAGGDEATRAQIRQEIAENSATQIQDLKTVIPAMIEFQEKMAKYTEGVPEFTDIESASDFRKWLSFHGAAGTAQLLPIIISSAMLGPAGGFTVATSLGLQGATNDRFTFIYDKVKNLPEDVQAELIAEYISETKDTTLAQAVVTGALEKVGSALVIPKALLSKIATKKGLKELSQETVSEVKEISLKAEAKDIIQALIGEGFTEGGETAVSIVQKLRLQEQEGNFFTKENMLEIANASAAGAAGASGVKGAQKIGASGIRNWRADTQSRIEESFFAASDVDPIIKGYVKRKMADGASFNEAFNAVQEDVLGKKTIAPFNLPDVQEFIDANEISDKTAQALINQTFRLLDSGKYTDEEVDLITARAEVLVDDGATPAKAFGQAKKELKDGELKADTEPRTEQETAPEETTDPVAEDSGQIPFDFGDPQGDLFTGQSRIDPNVMPGASNYDERTYLIQQHTERVGKEKQKIANKIKAYNKNNSQTKITEENLKEAEQQALTEQYAGSKPTARQLQLDFSRPLTDRIAEGIINETGTVVDQYPPVQAEAIYDRAVSLIDDGATVPNAFNRAKKEFADGTLELPDTQLDLDFGSRRGRPQRVDKTARKTEQQREKLEKKYPLPKILADQKVEQTQEDFFFNTLSTPLETRQLDPTKVNTTEVQKSFDRELTSNQSEAIVNNTFKLLGRYQDAEAFAVYQRARNLINSGMAVPVAFKKANAEYAKGEIPVSRGLPQNQQLDLALKEKRQPKRRFTDAKQMSLPGLEYQEGPSTFDEIDGEVVYVGPTPATSTEGQQELDFTFDRQTARLGRRTVFPTAEQELKTAQGSKYKVQPDGQVVRTTGDTTYAASPALFVNSNVANKLDTDKGVLRLGYDDNGTFKTVNNPNQIPEGAKPQVGLFNPRNNQLVERYSASKTPEVGLHPVEKRYNSDGTATTYVGRDISSISTSTQVAERKTLVIDKEKLDKSYDELDNNVGFGEEQLRKQADAMQSFARQTRQNLPQTVLNILTDPRGIALGALDSALIALDNRDLRRVYRGLGNFGKDDTDHFSEIIKLNNRMHAGHKEIIVANEEIISRWRKFNKNKEQGATLAEAMNESTRVNVDPTLYPSAQAAIDAKPDLDPDEIRMVFDAYNKLNTEGKKLYVEVRDAYDQNFKTFEDLLVKNIRRLGLSTEDEANAVKSIKSEFAAARSGVEVYFPLKRHGDFWLRISNGPNVGLYTFETEQELNVHKAKAEEQNLNITYGDKATNPIRQELQNENSIVKGLFNSIDNATQKKDGSKVNVQELKNQVLELYLQTQPGNSLRSAFATRKGTAGYSSDVLRSYAQTVNTMANTLPKLEYGQQMRMELSAMNDQVAGMPNQLRLNSVVSELRKRVDGELTAPPSDLLSTVLGLGNKAVFVYFMTTGKAAIIQAFQYAMVVGPVMQQKFGKDLGATKIFVAHKRQLNAYTRLGLGDKPGFMGRLKLTFNTSSYINNHKNSALLKQGWKIANDQNKFETTFTGDIADLARIPDGMETGILNKTKKGARVGFQAVATGFHNVERITREATYMLALELGLEVAQKKGLKGQAALDQAVEAAFDTVDEAMFDYSNFNKPRIMKTSAAARGVTQFMSFAYFANSLMARNFVNMIKPLGEQDRADAAKVFFGVQANTLLLAGIGGMYGYSTLIGPMLQVIMNEVINGADDEEDERTKLLKKYSTTSGEDQQKITNKIKAYNRNNPRTRITEEDLDKAFEHGLERYIAGDPFYHSSLEVWTNKWLIPYMFADKGTMSRFLNAAGVPDKAQDAIRLAVEKGIFAGLFDIDLSRSLSLDGFWVKDTITTPNDGVTQYIYNKIANSGLFPFFNLAEQIGTGIKELEEGSIERGMKKILPGFIKPGVDTAIKTQKGLVDYKGRQVEGFGPDFYRDAFKIIKGTLGFSGARENQRSTLSFQLNLFEKGTSAYRSKIIEKAAAALKAPAGEKYQENYDNAMAEVDKYNEEFGIYASYAEIDKKTINKRTNTRITEEMLFNLNYGVNTPETAASNLHRLAILERYLIVANERARKLMAAHKKQSEKIITDAINKGEDKQEITLPPKIQKFFNR